MTRRMVLLSLLAFLTAPAFAQKVYIDFDKNADFDSYQTFQFVETGEDISDTDPLMHGRVVEGIRSRFLAGGMKGVDSNPDLYVTYHAAEKEETRLNTSNFGYGYGPGWGWDPYWGGGYGMGSSTTQVVNYSVGTLIIDAWDAETKNLVWRGSITATVTDNPQKDEKKINKGLDKLVKEWQRKKKKMN